MHPSRPDRLPGFNHDLNLAEKQMVQIDIYRSGAMLRYGEGVNASPSETLCGLNHLISVRPS